MKYCQSWRYFLKVSRGAPDKVRKRWSVFWPHLRHALTMTPAVNWSCNWHYRSSSKADSISLECGNSWVGCGWASLTVNHHDSILWPFSWLAVVTILNFVLTSKWSVAFPLKSPFNLAPVQRDIWWYIWTALSARGVREGLAGPGS